MEEARNLKVQQTTHYEGFRLIKGNREINPVHVTRLVESMRKKPLVAQIIVNEERQIIDGQHRFNAMRHLGLPINYIMIEGYGENEVQLYNSCQANWKDIDFLEYFINKGETNYIRLKEFMEKYDVSLHIARLIVGQNYKDDDARAQFREGLFMWKNDNAHSEVMFYNRIRDGFEFGRARSFVRALMRILRNPETDWERLAQNMEKYAQMIRKSSNAVDFAKDIQRCYNYNRKKADQVQFVDELGTKPVLL